MNDDTVTVTRRIHFGVQRKGRQEILPGPSPTAPGHADGRVPRLSRLMALAIRFDGLIRSGEVAGQADLARLGHVTRARVTQIMNLLHLAPDIQEELLFLPWTVTGRDPIRERHLSPIAAVLDWRKQRRMWKELPAEEQAQPQPVGGGR
jgi:hypothetical protein